MKQRFQVALVSFSLFAIVLSACVGRTAQAEVDQASSTAPPATTAAPTEPLIENDTEPTQDPSVTPVVSHGGPVKDYVSLLDHLRAAGATVGPSGEVEQAFFTVTGQIIKVNGADVQVFEYADAEAAEAEAALVSEDGGSIGTTMVTWVEAPHFYKLERLIVLYVGTDSGVMALLESVLGPQFAGR